MKNSPLVSIIIVNWNGGKVFNKCLNSLSKIKYKNWELIVVDNGSVDGSEEFPYKIIRNKISLIRNKSNKGFAPANNQGASLAHGKYILLLNNDTIVTKDFLSILVNKMEKDDRIGILQPKILLMDKKEYLDNTGSFFTVIGFLQHQGFLEKDLGQYDHEQKVFSVKGACMLFRADLINKIGLFDNDFFSYFEESDFCWKAWLIGKKVLYYPKVFIYHKVGFTIRRLNVRDINFHYYKNRICSLIKNLEFKNLLFILPVHIIISLFISAFFFMRGNFKNSIMIFNALVWNIVNIDTTLKKRRKIQKIRATSDRELFKSLAVSINWGKYWNDLKRIEKDIKR